MGKLQFFLYEEIDRILNCPFLECNKCSMCKCGRQATNVLILL